MERAEQLSGDQGPVGIELVKRDINSSGLVGPITLRDGVGLRQRLPPKQEPAARDTKHCIYMLLDASVVPGEDRANGEVVKGPLLGQCLDVVQEGGG